MTGSWKVLAVVAAVASCGLAESKAEPRQGVVHVSRDIREQATRPLPPDWDDQVAPGLDWVKASAGKYKAAGSFADTKKLSAAYRVVLFIDFDNSIYWNQEKLQFKQLSQRLEADAKSGGKGGVAVNWHRLVKRGLVYEVIWALNDGGLTPDVAEVAPALPLVRGQ